MINIQFRKKFFVASLLTLSVALLFSCGKDTGRRDLKLSLILGVNSNWYLGAAKFKELVESIWWQLPVSQGKAFNVSPGRRCLLLQVNARRSCLLLLVLSYLFFCPDCFELNRDMVFIGAKNQINKINK